MYKLKIFFDQMKGTPPVDEINKWLSENQNIEITSITHHAVYADYVYIMYKDIEEDKINFKKAYEELVKQMEMEVKVASKF